MKQNVPDPRLTAQPRFEMKGAGGVNDLAFVAFLILVIVAAAIVTTMGCSPAPASGSLKVAGASTPPLKPGFHWVQVGPELWSQVKDGPCNCDKISAEDERLNREQKRSDPPLPAAETPEPPIAPSPAMPKPAPQPPEK